MLSRSCRIQVLFLGVVLIAIVVAFASPCAVSAELHPQDGPHVDLRFELRQDALIADVAMNLVFLDFMIESQREQADHLELSELKAMEGALLARMREVCAITADGIAIRPSLQALAMNEPDESLLPLFPQSGMRGLKKIRFQLVYPLSTSPKALGIVWSVYPPDELSTLNPRPPLVLAAELTAEGVRTQLEFRTEEPEFTWHSTPGGLQTRLLGVPAPATRAIRSVSLLALACVFAAVPFAWRALRRRPRGAAIAASLGLCVAAAASGFWMPVLRVDIADPFAASQQLPTVDEAKAIFDPLHANLYRAFDFADESAVYDALALSVDGPLLENLYLTIHRSLVMQEEGGAVSRVRNVRRVAVDVDSIGFLSSVREKESPSFVVQCRYQVDGRVTHWGHSHDRTIEYLARYTIVAGTAGWRIAAADVLSQSRIDGVVPDVTPKRNDGTFDL